jgi:RNA polymerase sigma factor (sigma-70 family)
MLTALPARQPTLPPHDDELTSLVRAAQSGDPQAWDRLVTRFDPHLRHVARGFRLPPADVDDIVQTTWLRVLGRIQQIREPSALGGWLATITRREALRLLQRHVREVLSDDPELGECADDHQPESAALEAERHAALTRALATLPPRHAHLMRLLATSECYQHISLHAGMPLGSIGPTRARCLARLSRHPELRALHA